MITANLNKTLDEANEKLEKARAATSRKIQEIVERQKVNHAGLKKIRAEFEYISVKLPNAPRTKNNSRAPRTKKEVRTTINSLLSKVDLSRYECPKPASEKRPDCPVISAPSLNPNIKVFREEFEHKLDGFISLKVPRSPFQNSDSTGTITADDIDTFPERQEYAQRGQECGNKRSKSQNFWRK